MIAGKVMMVPIKITFKASTDEAASHISIFPMTMSGKILKAKPKAASKQITTRKTKISHE